MTRRGRRRPTPAVASSSARRLGCVIYARWSTREQDGDHQVRTLKRWCEQRGWKLVATETDTVTGDPERRKTDPPGLVRALAHIAQRRATVLAVFAGNRLVRSTLGLLQLVHRVNRMGGQIASYTDGADLDTTSDLGEILVAFAGWRARMDLAFIRRGTVSGLAAARARGVVLGRPRVAVDVEQLVALRAASPPLSFRRCAARLGCSEGTVRRAYAAYCRRLQSRGRRSSSARKAGR